MFRALIRLASWILLLGGGYLAWRGASDYFESVDGQKTESLAWEQQVNSIPSVDSQDHDVLPAKLSQQHKSVVIQKGSSIAKLSIPRLSTVLYVLEGTDDKDLKRGPGHLEGSVMPGSDGNCVIAGHRDTHFRVLKDVHKGDIILVQSHEKTYRYRVSGLSVVTPDNTQSLQPTDKAVLNLVTCFPFEYVGSAPRRFVVHADLISSGDSKG